MEWCEGAMLNKTTIFMAYYFSYFSRSYLNFRRWRKRLPTYNNYARLTPIRKMKITRLTYLNSRNGIS
jgi:hypothetical protein